MPYARKALRPEQWPLRDREAWDRANRKADILDDPGQATHWRTKSRQIVATRYGLWLAFLRELGRLDFAASPASRVTKENLERYLESLRARNLSPVTIAGYVRDLLEAIRVMEPAADLSVLRHLLVRLEAVAEPVRDKRLLVVSPVVLLKAAISEMRRQSKALLQKPSRHTAERFRDALIVMFLATRPVRLANCASIELDRHLVKIDDIYWCRFSAEEVKDGQRLDFPLPRAITPWLDHYLAEHRPLLLRGKSSSRLWISIRSTPMADNTIYCRVTHFTKQFVGHAVNPHLFRDCVTTFIANVAPEEIWIVREILGHSSLRMSEEHYNHAGRVIAQNRYHSALAQLVDNSTSIGNDRD